MRKDKVVKLESIDCKVLVRRSTRAKHLQIKINALGEVTLVLPKNCSESQGIHFLNQKKGWIAKKIKTLDFKSNKYRYLGSVIKINELISPDSNIKMPYFNGEELIVPNGTNSIRNELYEEWLFNEAKLYIIPRVYELAKKYGFYFEKVSIKNLKSRWGSCSSKRRLSFNCKLMYFNTKTIDYVIVHELCHLKEMNHSKNFWRLVEDIIPDYKIYKKKLTIN